MVGNGLLYECCKWRKDGTLFLMYSSYEESADEETEQASETDNLFKMDYRYMIVSPEGEMRDLPVPFNLDNYEILTNCWYTPDNRLFASQGGAFMKSIRRTER